MQTLRSHVGGRWIEGSGALETLVNPATEEPLARAGAGGIDRKAALEFARARGGPPLRALTFAERGAPLEAGGGAPPPHPPERPPPSAPRGRYTRGGAQFAR